jgi:hypothetical protein
MPMSVNSAKPELEGFVLVALGSFNPAIFQPFWFSRNNLIREEEAQDAKVEIVHKQATVFGTEWFSLQVMPERFSLDTSDPTKSLPLRDLAVGTFKILEHTPVEAFGFNSYKHFRMPSMDEWHAFGHHYAPKESWTGILTDPGMKSLTILGKRENRTEPVQVTIEPSVKVHPGVFFQVNQHFAFKEKKDAVEDHMQVFLKELQNSWPDFLSYSDRVSQHLLNHLHKQGK